MIKRILVIDDEEKLAILIKRFLTDSGYSVEICTQADQGLFMALSEDFDLIISDISMPKMEGTEILQKVKAVKPDQAFILITAFATIEKAFQASKLGADYFLKKPFELQELKIFIEKINTTGELKEEISLLHSKQNSTRPLDAIIGTSDVISAIKKQIRDVARFDTSVLITGESGTGKELVAKAIHANSPRCAKSFVPVNCSAIPESLLESEFFGYMKGSFTGAYANKKGLFEEADQGTLFLDEIGDLPVHMQAKVLRAIQEKKVRRIGDTKEIPVDVKLICATGRDLSSLIKEKKFREDLFYRINVININIPPLRQRVGDIPVLTAHFLRKISKKLGVQEKKLAPEALSALESNGFPGNVRELENMVERLIILSAGNTINSADVKKAISSPADDGTGSEVKVSNFDVPYKEAFDKIRTDFDKQYILDALVKNNNSQKQTAEYLGISLRLLQYKLKEIKGEKEIPPL
jgi:DNA-binding NtrC family response regulator